MTSSQIEQVGLRRQRPRERDALALAARQLAGEAVRQPPRQPHALEQLADLALGLGARQPPQHAAAGRTIDAPHAVARVERRVRVLEHDLDPPADARAGACGRAPASRLAVEA